MGKANKHGVRQVSIKVKLMAPIAVVVAVICLAMGVMFRNRLQADLIATNVDMAVYVGRQAVQSLDADSIPRLLRHGEDSAAYAEVAQALNNAKEDTGVRFIYLVCAENGRLFYAVDTDQDDHQAMGTEYEVDYEILRPLFERGETIKEGYIEDADGEPITTTYVPVRDRNGAVIAAVGCDFDATKVVAAISETTRNVALIGLACFLGSVAFFWVLAGRLIRNLQTVDDKIHEIVSSGGDLTRQIDLRTGDEIESIADHVNDLLAYMRRIMTEIAASSDALRQSSQTVHRRVGETKGNVDSMSGTLDNMAATMEETTAAINEINSSVGDVYRFIESISEEARSGGELSAQIRAAAAETLRSVTTERQGAEQLTRQLADSLQERIEQSRTVREIDALTQGILNITKQTRLLALNANIEAARAGEQGKGFAVVAGRVGELAAESAETAVKIQDVSNAVVAAVAALADESAKMIDFVQHQVLAAYAELVKTSERHHADAATINDTMAAFLERSAQLQANMDRIRQGVNEINTSVENSAVGIGKISESSSGINEAVSEIAGGTTSIGGVSEQFSREVARFKI